MFHAIGQFYPDYKREESNNEYFKCMKYGRDYITIRDENVYMIYCDDVENPVWVCDSIKAFFDLMENN